MPFFSQISFFSRETTSKDIGDDGESWVHEVLLEEFKDCKDVFVFHNIVLPNSQIDHVVVTNYGIFVIETKNWSGWIYGDEKSQKWMRSYYGDRDYYENPILQNNYHIKRLAQFLSVSPLYLYSIVVMVGDCTLKTREALPPYVMTSACSVPQYIKQFNEKKNYCFFQEDLERFQKQLLSLNPQVEIKDMPTKEELKDLLRDVMGKSNDN